MFKNKIKMVILKKNSIYIIYTLYQQQIICCRKQNLEFLKTKKNQSLPI